MPSLGAVPPLGAAPQPRSAARPNPRRRPRLTRSPLHDPSTSTPPQPHRRPPTPPPTHPTPQVWDGLQYSTFATIPRPSGLALSAATLYASSHSNGHVYAWARSTGVLLQMVQAAPYDSLLGLALAPTSGSSAEPAALFAIDASVNGIRRIETTDAACPALPPSTPPGAASGCYDGLRNGEETDADCGGRFCARCAVGKLCDANSDCASHNCDVSGSGRCAAAVQTQHDASFLRSYLNSDFYTNSFAHHMNHGNMSGASYLNPYPIMESSFCSTVGVVNGAVNCSLIDYDSLLLGGCWCHVCLPENPCQNGGTCRNHENKGYTCECPAGTSGDHCQVGPNTKGDLTDPFPFYVAPLLPLPPARPPPRAPSSPEMPPGFTRKHVTRVELVASGSVSDYSAEIVAAIAAQFATELNVSTDAVNVSVTAASVRLTVEVTFTQASAAQTARTQLLQVVGSQTAATAFLRRVAGLENVWVEAEPVLSVETVDTVLAQQEAGPHPLAPELLAAAIAGSVGGVAFAFLVTVIYCRVRAKRRAKKRRTSSLPGTTKVMAEDSRDVSVTPKTMFY